MEFQRGFLFVLLYFVWISNYGNCLLLEGQFIFGQFCEESCVDTELTGNARAISIDGVFLPSAEGRQLRCLPDPNHCVLKSRGSWGIFLWFCTVGVVSRMEKFWEVPRLLWGESWERNREGVVCVLPSGGDAGEALGTASSDPSIGDDQGRSSPPVTSGPSLWQPWSASSRGWGKRRKQSTF